MTFTIFVKHLWDISIVVLAKQNNYLLILLRAFYIMLILRNELTMNIHIVDWTWWARDYGVSLVRFSFQRSYARMGNSDALLHVPFLRSAHDSDIAPLLQNMRGTLQGDIVHSRTTDWRAKGTNAVQENRHPHALLSINFYLVHKVTCYLTSL